MSLTILGTGSALPARAVANQELTVFYDTSDEWIATRTGIRQRRVMAEGETVTGLAMAAAGAALENAGTRPEELDYILCATLGGDYITPSLGCMVQAGLGAACPALDVNAACTGFLYALDVAAALLARGGVKRILLVAAEGLSRVVDWTDRATSVLFGDGAGAAVLAPGDDLLHLHLTSAGIAEPLNIAYPRGNFPGRAGGESMVVRMDGAEVYRFAVTAIVTGVRRALQETGLEAEAIDHLLLHQANLRIIEAARKKLAVPAERCHTNVDQVGNMSAASIAVLMDQCARAGRFKKGDLLALSGFGGGLTTGTALLRWGRA